MQRVVDLQIVGDRCYYRLDCTDDEMMDLINYRSWIHRTWTMGNVRKYFVFLHTNRGMTKILWTSVGFSSMLVRYLQFLGYLINGKELLRSREIRIGNMLYQPYDFQSQAIESWINNGHVGIVKSPTGSGKTILACKIIQRMQVRTIIIVHTSDLLVNAWLNTLIEQFGDYIRDMIGVIGGGVSKKDRQRLGIVTDTSYETNISKDIVIATSQTLLGKLKKLCNEKFGLLIVDEIHHYGSDEFSKVVSSIKAVYKCGLSATVTRSDGASPLFFGLMGDVCFRISIRELVQKGILVEPVFTSIVINDETIQNKVASCGLVKLRKSTYVKQMSASSVIKVKYILNLVESLYRNKKKFVIYSDFVSSKNKEVFIRDFYVRELNRRGIRVIGVSADMTGSERSNVFDMLENGKIDGLVFGLLGSEGIDIPVIDSVVMCNSTKSVIRYTQRTGRAMRVVKGDKHKKANAYIYELLLNVPMELKWMEHNFTEYKQENYVKRKIYVNNINTVNAGTAIAG